MQNKCSDKSISRRHFIKNAAVVAGGSVLVGCSAKTVVTSTPETENASEPAATESEVTPDMVAATTESTATTCPDYMTADLAAKKWGFEIAPDPIPDRDIQNTVEADIIVIGSGMSGLVTANSAAENGAKVVLFSASSGTTYRGGSIHAANSKVMEKYWIEPYDVETFFRWELNAASYNVDQEKWWKFYNNSEEAMNWLIDKMETAGYTCVLEHGNTDDDDGPSNTPTGSHSFISSDMRMAGLGAQFCVDTLAKTAQNAGVEIIYKMTAKQLVREENNTGRVTAVIAQAEDGNYTKYVGSKGIVLATGDFSADKEMMTKYCPWVMPLLSDTGDMGYDNNFKFGGLFKGEGQKMGLWIGAAWQKTYPNAPMIQGSWICSNQPYGAHRGLLVNKNGHRYGNEDVNGPYAGIAQMHQPDMAAYAIWGTNYLKANEPWYTFGLAEGASAVSTSSILEDWESNVENGTYFKADNLEDLITQMGLPLEDTLAAVTRYNELCQKGKDADFHKRAKFMIPISDGPFYGGQAAVPTFLTVLGGLRTNLNMQVCDENDQPIPGLFNVGTMIGDYYANCYNFRVAGNNYGGNCLTFGYLTGRAIALDEL